MASMAIGRSRRESIVVGLLFCFCTFNLPSSRDGYEHPYEALLILLSYTTAWQYQRPANIFHNRRWLVGFFVAGLLLSLALLFRPTAILAAPGLFIICKRLENIVVASCGLTLGIGILGFYNQVRFGSPVETGYLQAWLTANPELFDSGFSAMKMLPQAVALWMSPGKGLLLYSPILLSLFLIKSDCWKNKSRVIIAIFTTSFIYTFFYASNFAWHGSAWCWGPRYLIPIVPLLTLLIPIPTSSSYIGRTALALVLLSAYVQLGAILVNYKRHLLQTFLVDPDAFEDGRIFFDLSLSPLLSIPTNFHYLYQRLNSSDLLFSFTSPGPWKNEARPVDIKTMLDVSIDLNTIDIWWIRFLYLPVSDAAKLIGFIVGLGAILCLIWCVRLIIVNARA
jgi:hypothetical protein